MLLLFGFLHSVPKPYLKNSHSKTTNQQSGSRNRHRLKKSCGIEKTENHFFSPLS